MTETKVRHPETGQAADVAEMVITDANGVGSEVLALNLGSRAIYRKNWEVALALVGCTAETSGAAQWLNPWSCVIEPLAGHQQLPWNTKVLMAGVDITDTSYDKSTGTISISSVTGDITIEAEAVMMPSEYEPVEYIFMISHSTSARLLVGYPATHNTEFEFWMSSASGGCLISHAGHNTTGSGVTTPDFVCRTNYTSSDSGFNIKRGNTIFSSNAAPGSHGAWTIPSTHCIVVIGKTISISTNGREPYSIDDGTEFVTPNDVILLGSASSASGNHTGRHDRIIHRESGVVTHDYVPVLIKATGYVGWYDVINQELKGNYAPSLWLKPNVHTTRHYTGCSATRLSSAETGTAAYAVIGSTWSIKITPSSGYTFTGGTTPQVLIDGVDVTSQVVSDNGDGTYTITIANVEDKPIEITARCSEIINVQGSQTYTPSVTVGTAYTAILTPGTGYQMLPWNTVVMDNGVDITASAYNKSTNIISIDSVAGEVTITAESVEMGDEYEPVEYIKSPYPGTAACVVNLEYVPNHKTKLEIDAHLADDGYPILLFGANNVNTAAPAVRFYQFQNIVANGGAMAWGPNRRATSAVARAGCERRFNFVCDRGVFTFLRATGDVNTIDISSDDEWQETANVRLFGAYYPSDRYFGSGTVWGIKASEIETVDGEEVQTWKRVYLPAKRRSDGCPGFYDQVSGTLFIEKPSWTLPGEETNTNATNNTTVTNNTENEEI